MRIVDLHGRTKAHLLPDGAQAACEQLWRHDFPQYAKDAEVFWEQDENGKPFMRYRFTGTMKGFGRTTVERACDYQLAPPCDRTFFFRDRPYRLDSSVPAHQGLALMISRHNTLLEEIALAETDSRDTRELFYMRGQRDILSESIIELLRVNHLF